MLLAALLAALPPQDPDPVAILAARCVACHGPDVQRKSLRLDRRELMLRGGRSGPAIVPGDADRSLLVLHVTASGGKRRMPAEGEPLGPAEIAAMRRWIAAGAPWPEPAAPVDPRHWSYRPIVRPAIPEGPDAGGASGAIDAFVRARLAAAGLAPSPAADRAALIRRVSLDLCGLPPTLAEVDAFLADEAPGAWERVVDRLLASPHYGERMASTWLDLARYADTKGYEKDDRRTIWRYRDWVIAAFNRDLPFDEFTVEQLAGDLLPSPTTDQLLATAFHRNTMTNDEGGTDDEEFRVAAVVDRVNTTFDVWMGTTMGCVQCHEHKYDPIEHREYYELLAFFDNTADADRPDDAPTIETPTAEQAAELAAIDGELAAARARLAAEGDERRAAWERTVRARLDAFAAMAPRLSPWWQSQPFPAPTFEAAFATRHAAAPGAGSAWWVEADRPDGVVHRGIAGDSTAVFLRRTIEVARGGRAALSLGSDDALRVWLDGRELLAENVHRGAAADQHLLDVELRRGRHELVLQVVNGAGESGFYFDLRAAALDAETLAALRATEPTAKQRARIAEAHRDRDPGLRSLRDRIAALEQRRKDLRIPRTPILRELPPDRARTTRVHRRGSFLDQGEVVRPGVPSAWRPLPDGAPRDRLGLARWLVSPDNPLTARVIANRIWEQLFGRGLVATSEDFGTQGERPSHPELLDWLAAELRDGGWSIKHLLRTIVLSATYRQSSAYRDGAAALDPDNRLLWRSPRLRLRAEAIRDQALAAGGLLNPAIGGPSVMPPQPDGVWQVVYSSDRWQTAEGPDRYRRALYTFWRRTAPYPSMAAFDAPSREFCVVRRERTNTPLQALVTLNDPAFVECARGLGERMRAIGGGDAARLALGFRICTARRPSAAELDRLGALLEGERGAYPDEAGAWTAVANVLLNLDEVLCKP